MTWRAWLRVCWHRWWTPSPRLSWQLVTIEALLTAAMIVVLAVVTHFTKDIAYTASFWLLTLPSVMAVVRDVVFLTVGRRSPEAATAPAER